MTSLLNEDRPEHSTGEFSADASKMESLTWCGVGRDQTQSASVVWIVNMTVPPASLLTLTEKNEWIPVDTLLLFLSSRGRIWWRTMWRVGKKKAIIQQQANLGSKIYPRGHHRHPAFTQSRHVYLPFTCLVITASFSQGVFVFEIINCSARLAIFFPWHGGRAGSELVYLLADSWCFPSMQTPNLHNLRIILRFVLCRIYPATTLTPHLDFKKRFCSCSWKFKTL